MGADIMETIDPFGNSTYASHNVGIACTRNSDRLE